MLLPEHEGAPAGFPGYRSKDPELGVPPFLSPRGGNLLSEAVCDHRWQLQSAHQDEIAVDQVRNKKSSLKHPSGDETIPLLRTSVLRNASYDSLSSWNTIFL